MRRHSARMGVWRWWTGDHGAPSPCAAARRASLVGLALLTLGTGCRLEERPREAETARLDAARLDAAHPERFALGRAPTPAELAAIDVDVDSTGAGLPAGRGDTQRGQQLYREQCAACHGLRGEGIAPYPALVGRLERDQFAFGSNMNLVRTIGNYWPLAPTLFDYIRRTMPLTAPGSLSADEVYSLTAYLLAANEIIPAGSTLDSASLIAVRMPAHDRFVRDDRRGGPEVR